MLVPLRDFARHAIIRRYFAGRARDQQTTMTDPLANQTAASFPALPAGSAGCPSCGAIGLDLFYDLREIPVHSCVLTSSRKEALDFPTGDLVLGVCPRCGFITNTAYDAHKTDYAHDYEETQGFSPTFNAFARTLAARLAERHDLRKRLVLEIGCGRGEFLALLCELANCRGIGIDPAWRPHRLESPALSRIEFVPEVYDERYAHLEADLVVCRHTLEHIAPVGQFLKQLRAAIGERKEAVVFFEVPDVMRVLREGAFWDLYYEHCSLFTAGSLARLFRSGGFKVRELELVFEGQYLVLTAVPGGDSDQLPLEDDLAELLRQVRSFPETCRATLQRWQRYLDDGVKRGERMVLWGSGSKAAGFLTTLRCSQSIRHVVDINPHKQGKFLPGTGQEIVAPDFLTGFRPDRVIVMNPIYLDEIGQDLSRMNLTPDLVAI